MHAKRTKVVVVAGSWIEVEVGSHRERWWLLGRRWWGGGGGGGGGAIGRRGAAGGIGDRVGSVVQVEAGQQGRV